MGVISKDLPFADKTFRSGSTIVENCKLKSFNPANPDNTINRDAEPIITPIAAIMVIEFMALLLLLESK